MENGDLIGHEVKTLSNLIKRHIDASAANSVRKDLTGMQTWIIRYIYERQNKEEVFQRDIEKQFQIRRSTATEILQLMEKHKLIERYPVEYDARLKKIVLTEQAEKVHLLIKQDIIETETRMRKDISKEDLNTFFRVIRKIQSNMKEA